MKIYSDLRNQHTTLDGKKATNRIRGQCERCGTGIERRKRFCLPCSADRLQETIAANRHKYKGRKYGKRGA